MEGRYVGVEDGIGVGRNVGLEVGVEVGNIAPISQI